jgi:hypothetical protein
VSRSPFPRGILVSALTVVALMLAGTATASASEQFYLHNSQTVTDVDHCYIGYGYVDLLSTLPSGQTAAFTGGARMACTQPFSTGAELAAGSGQLELWFTNTNKKSCTTTWWLYNNATPTHAGEIISGSFSGGPTITVPANTKVPTKFTVPFTVPAKSLAPDDQLQLHVNTRTASGSCSNMTLYYGSADRASNVFLPTLVANPSV